MYSRRTWIVATIFLAARTSYSCEPILPLVQVVGGPGYLLMSFWSLLGFVLLKAVVFSRLQDGLPRVRAAWYMVIGNALTTIIGMGVAIVFVIPTLLPITLIGVWALSLVPARRLVEITENRFIKRIGAGGVSLILIGLLFLSLTFAAGQGAAAAEKLTLYWLLKVTYVYFALIVSMVLTTFWEEWVISRMAAETGKEGVFAVAVFRSNAVVLGLAAIMAAFLMLPQRFHSPDGLVHLMNLLFSRVA